MTAIPPPPLPRKGAIERLRLWPQSLLWRTFLLLAVLMNVEHRFSKFTISAYK